MIIDYSKRYLYKGLLVRPVLMEGSTVICYDQHGGTILVPHVEMLHPTDNKVKKIRTVQYIIKNDDISVEEPVVTVPVVPTPVTPVPVTPTPVPVTPTPVTPTPTPVVPTPTPVVPTPTPTPAPPPDDYI